MSITLRSLASLSILALSINGSPAFAAPYSVVTLGDAAAEQLGATVRCSATIMTPAYACLDGTGFVEVLVRMMSRYEPTAFQNLAAKPARTVDVGLEQVPMMSPRTNVAVLYVGTVDSAFIAGHKGYTLRQWYADYDWLVGLIHRRAPLAKVILLTVPRPILTDEESRVRADVTGAMSRHISRRPEPVLDLNCRNFSKAAFLDPTLAFLSDKGSSAIARGLFAISLGLTREEASASACAALRAEQ